MTVAALYIDPRGPYPKMPGVECWDEARDAHKYDGPYPVVAHPPCGPWGRLRHLYRGNEHDCAPAAVDAVRRWGGVLEHPAMSLLWDHCRLPVPGGLPDEHAGMSIQIDQCAWGHVARKTSWLYFVGVDSVSVLRGVRTGGIPTHWISGFRPSKARNLYKSNGSAVPVGIKVCSAQQRRRTPPLFAEWLVAIAESSWTFGSEGIQ